MKIYLNIFFLSLFLIVTPFIKSIELLPLAPFEPILQLKPGTPNQLSDLDGITPEEIDNHFAYYAEGIDELNAAINALDNARANTADPVVINSLRSGVTSLYNRMVLHEYYFGTLQSQDPQGGTGVEDPEQLEEVYPGVYGTGLNDAINRDFGTFEDWQNDFAMGAKDDVGWMILCADPFLQVNQNNEFCSMPICTPRRLMNIFVTLNDLGLLCRFQPIVVMDMYEHAYIIDFGTRSLENQDAYINAFFNNIDWTKAAARYNAVCSWGELTTPPCSLTLGVDPCSGELDDLPAIPNQPNDFPDLTAEPPDLQTGIIEPQPWWAGTAPAIPTPLNCHLNGQRQGGISLP